MLEEIKLETVLGEEEEEDENTGTWIEVFGSTSFSKKKACFRNFCT